MRTGYLHVFPVFRNRTASDLNTLRLQNLRNLIVGEGLGGVFFFDQPFDPSLQNQQ
jgi:hypothetical protein